MFTEQHMTAESVVKSYREAKDKKKQIAILAQLNACSQDDILKVLVDNGVNGRSLPRNSRKPSKDTGEVLNVDQPITLCEEEKEIHDPTFEDVTTYLESLKSRKRNLMKEIKSIDHEIDKIIFMCRCCQGEKVGE